MLGYTSLQKLYNYANISHITIYLFSSPPSFSRFPFVVLLQTILLLFSLILLQTDPSLPQSFVSALSCFLRLLSRFHSFVGCDGLISLIRLSFSGSPAIWGCFCYPLCVLFLNVSILCFLPSSKRIKIECIRHIWSYTLIISRQEKIYKSQSPFLQCIWYLFKGFVNA